MHWRLKAFTQAAFGRLPASAGLQLYYGVQRACGSLRRVNPLAGFEDGLRLVTGIEAAGRSVADRTILEVGTGRRINVPLVFWLCGASRIITVDRNPYLKTSLIAEDLDYIRRNPAVVRAAFGTRLEDMRFQYRFDLIASGALSVARLMTYARIQYSAPADAAALTLAAGAIDYHVSNNTLEHVRPVDLRRILREGKRLVGDGGLLVHRVDFADHFAECDPRISTVNFLQYSDRRWSVYAGNRYGYHNRLRIDELEALVQEEGLEIVGENAEVDPAAIRALASGLPLDRRFAGKPNEVNATASVLVVMRVQQSGPAVRRRRRDSATAEPRTWPS